MLIFMLIGSSMWTILLEFFGYSNDFSWSKCRDLNRLNLWQRIYNLQIRNYVLF